MSGCKCPYVTAQRGDKVNLRHLGGFGVNKVGAFNAAVLIFPARFNPSGDETSRKHADGSEVLAAEKKKDVHACKHAKQKTSYFWKMVRVSQRQATERHHVTEGVEIWIQDGAHVHPSLSLSVTTNMSLSKKLTLFFPVVLFFYWKKPFKEVAECHTDFQKEKQFNRISFILYNSSSFEEVYRWENVRSLDMWHRELKNIYIWYINKNRYIIYRKGDVIILLLFSTSQMFFDKTPFRGEYW